MPLNFLKRHPPPDLKRRGIPALNRLHWKLMAPLLMAPLLEAAGDESRKINKNSRKVI
jgi:hypothetical protein